MNNNNGTDTGQIIDVEAEIAGPPMAVARRPLPHESYLPVMSMQEAQNRLNALKQFVREQMRKDVDFGVIPGTGDKPTLLKPGAEKLCTFFGLSSRFEIRDKIEEWDRGLFNYWYKCRLFRGDYCIAEGEGSANSREKKYRWKSVPFYKATPEEKARGREETRPGKHGSTYKVIVLENDDPFTLVNTLQKMAQKRALIAATLIGVNASEFFTQDIEDIADPDSPALGDEEGAGAEPSPPAPTPSVPAPPKHYQTPQPKRTAETPTDPEPPQSKGKSVLLRVNREGQPKEGTGQRGHWTKWGFQCSDNNWYGTFDKENADKMREAIVQGFTVMVTYETDGKFNTIVKGGVRFQ